MRRTWRDCVLDAMRRSAVRSSDGLIYRYRLLEDELEQICAETGSKGETPEQTLSRTLQELRDEGEIEFVGNGAYRLVAVPIDIEDSDLIDSEIDSRIRRKLLHIGRVETDNPVSLARRRRGQDRIRVLTLHNYQNQCALCDIKNPALLIASHIVPWSASEEARGDLTNVICLCKFHDALFELGYWTLDDAFRLLTKSVEGAWVIKAVLPPSIYFSSPNSFVPAKVYLGQHRERHGFNIV